ncbi:hypothetical protein DRF75_03890 [Ehrlichia minasensis]|uniref:Uncharacterized protein n=1 Tax=Ehrlichia minasensis TaxID=1242993 RepID=A0A4Q6I5M6_9RICK|nr:hypothetical protein [Ehrlichia minasensis]RZB12473.1 hypothetical protein DRF75_03890 [Ehrlichia minasensis]
MNSQLMIAAIALLAVFIVLLVGLLITAICKCCARPKKIEEEKKPLLGDEGISKTDLLSKIESMERELQEVLSRESGLKQEKQDLLAKLNEGGLVTQKLQKECSNLMESNMALAKKNAEIESALEHANAAMQKLENEKTTSTKKGTLVSSRVDVLSWGYGLLNDCKNVFKNVNNSTNLSESDKKQLGDRILNLKESIQNFMCCVGDIVQGGGLPSTAMSAAGVQCSIDNKYITQ